MTIDQKVSQVVKLLDHLRNSVDAGIDIAINAGATTSKLECAIIPATCDNRLKVSVNVTVETKLQIQQEIAEYAKQAAEAERVNDMNKNLINVGKIMGHVVVLRELGYQVDTVHYTHGSWRVPCEIRINGEEIYHIEEFPQQLMQEGR